MIQLYELELEKECPYGKDADADLEVLLNECKKSIKDCDEELIKKAFWFCYEAHKGVKRSSGVPYYTHPLKVALSLLKEFDYGDNEMIPASLLHDTVEDVESVTIEVIEKEFGKKIADIVDAVTKIKGEKTRQLDKAATYGKLFHALINDLRVILIKLSDRLDNMRTLEHLATSKQKAIGEETLNFYTPFAQRLGLIKIKRHLEILSFYFMDPEAFAVIREQLEEKRTEFLGYIQNFYEILTQKLNEKNINHVLTIEHKHPYEIYKRIQDGERLEDIDNFYSMVVVISQNDFAECYRAYGVIANVFGPVSSLQDYIARPKINLYRALHSTHFGPGRKLVEVIIRTDEMDQIAEGGIAALYRLKLVKRPLMKLDEPGVENWLEWMDDLITENDPDAIQKIWGSIKMNQYEDEINIFTDKGVSIRLPSGACPIDLAFAIDDELGKHCISAKVNGEIKALNYELKNYEKVELITSPNSLPSHEWQDYVITHKAIVYLHKYFKQQKVYEIKNKIIPHTDKSVRFRIVGDDRPGMLNEITQAIGAVNIQRISLSTADSQFEGAFSLSIPDESFITTIYTRLLNIKGLRGVEQIEDPED